MSTRAVDTDRPTDAGRQSPEKIEKAVRKEKRAADAIPLGNWLLAAMAGGLVRFFRRLLVWHGDFRWIHRNQQAATKRLMSAAPTKTLIRPKWWADNDDATLPNPRPATFSLLGYYWMASVDNHNVSLMLHYSQRLDHPVAPSLVGIDNVYSPNE